MVSILVTDDGFHPWSSLSHGQAPLIIQGDNNPEDVDLETAINSHGAIIIIEFPSSADGRGFSLANNLRLQGFAGQIFACGFLICDQYRHARQSGFDGVLLNEAQAKRMPEPHWLEQAKRVGLSYRDRIYA